MERAAEGKIMSHSETMDGGRADENIANMKPLKSNYIIAVLISLLPYRAEFSRNAKNVTPGSSLCPVGTLWTPPVGSLSAPRSLPGPVPVAHHGHPCDHPQLDWKREFILGL